MIGLGDNAMKSKTEVGMIFNTQKFSIHDGAGIRTLIFMKGCPLGCLWCSNPESQDIEVEIMDVRSNCIRCGKCAGLCESGAVDSNTFEINRKLCIRCGKCVQHCYANAKKTIGKRVTLREIMDLVEKDRIVYQNSGGGVTIGGGEPTMQPEFTASVLRECRNMNIHTAIETCGWGTWEQVGKAIQYADQIFMDLKTMDPKTHKRLTGADNSLILQNAAMAANLDKELIFRIPLIPGQNDDRENLVKIGTFIADLAKRNNRIAAEVLPYHGLGKDKYKWLSRKYEMEMLSAPDSAAEKACKRILTDCGCNVIEVE